MSTRKSQTLSKIGELVDDADIRTIQINNAISDVEATRDAFKAGIIDATEATVLLRSCYVIGYLISVDLKQRRGRGRKLLD